MKNFKSYPPEGQFMKPEDHNAFALALKKDEAIIYEAPESRRLYCAIFSGLHPQAGLHISQPVRGKWQSKTINADQLRIPADLATDSRVRRWNRCG